ncbi:MAG: response regulator [Candidatus Latescibacteria bacterium]|nr:response regulator [Candidatus Latescibacterota bacterium]
MSRLLVVDDEEPVRNVLTTFLTRKGYEVEEAGNGPNALAQLERFKPHLVLLDIRMPGMDGIEVLKAIKQRAPDVVVIMVTATSDNEVGRRTLELGASDYVTKPFSFEQLDNQLTVHLTLHSEE